MKPKCELFGERNSAFNLVTRVCNTLRKEGLEDQVKEFNKRAWDCESYGTLIDIAKDYIEIE